MFSRVQLKSNRQSEFGKDMMVESKVDFIEDIKKEPLLDTTSYLITLKDLQSKKLKEIISEINKKQEKTQPNIEIKENQPQDNFHIKKLDGDLNMSSISLEQNNDIKYMINEIKKWDYYFPSIEFITEDLKIIVSKKRSLEEDQNLKDVIELQIEIENITLLNIKNLNITIKTSSKS